MTADPGTAAAGASATAAMEPVDRALRRLRPVIGAVLIGSFVVRGDSRALGVADPLAIAGAISLFLLSRMAGARLAAAGPRGRALSDAFGVAVDAGVTVLAVTTFEVLDPELGWALLVVPVLEGALRFRIRGAVVVWCAISAAYLKLQLSVPGDLSDPVTQTAFLEQIQSLVYRCGIVLLVAVPGGYLSDQLLRAIAAQRRAHLGASERSSQLVRVVDAGRALGTWGADVPSLVVEAALTLGFDVADWTERDDAGAWRATRARHALDGATLPAPDALDVLCDTVSSSGRTMLATADDEDEATGAALMTCGLAGVLAAPIRGRAGTIAILRVGLVRGREATEQQIESLELLAGQAGVAGDNAQLVAEIQAVRTDLEHQATHDALTGLPNRPHVRRHLAECLAALADDPRPLSVLFLDLDRFKAVNDDLGHEIGDDLLRAVAERLRAVARATDLVARLGGDEFLIVAPHTDDAAATALAARIVDVLGQTFPLREHTVSVGASVGIVVTDVPTDAGEVIRRGDLAMYQAKAQGRSTWRQYSPELDREARARARLETDLRVAVAESQLEAAYQPVVDLLDHRVRAVEALVRWRHPRLGMVPPDVFVPVAEQSDLIEALGRFMLDEATRRAAQWHAATGGHGPAVAVNVSPHQVRRDGFVDRVLAVLRAHALPADRLVLELTERVLIDADVAGPLAALRSAGVRIALDDFGQGHTSIGSLARLPVDMVKIDRSFISGLQEDERRQSIVRAMASVAHDLDLLVVAEGVEHEAEAVTLREIGCDRAQGWYFRPPLPADDLHALLLSLHHPATPATSNGPRS